MQAFDDQLALQSPFAAQMGGWGRTDVIEADDGSEYTVRVEVPGCHKENTKVTIKENVMRVRADREDESDDSGDGFTTHSSFVAHFDRSWTLPEDFDKDSVTRFVHKDQPTTTINYNSAGKTATI